MENQEAIKAFLEKYKDLNRNLFKLYFDKHAPRNS